MSHLGGAPFARMAITVPPDGWFRGIAHALFDRYRQALLDLGVALFEVPLDAFLIPDAARIPVLIEDLRAFGPQCAFGLPLGSYALLCRLPAQRDGWRPNVFTDVLDIPTICLWDHAPVELADQLLLPHPSDPAASLSGADATLRRVLTHPRVIHWSRDSGQTRIMRALGYLSSNRLIEELPPALPGFSPRDHSEGASEGASVGFVGHVYQEPPSFPRPALETLAADAIRVWLDADERAPLWDVLDQQVALLSDEERRRLALDRDQQYFWHFAHRLICHQAQTAVRLKMLGGARVPVSCHGNLKAGVAGVPSNLVPIATDVPYGPELAALFARHAITIDVLSPGFVQGYSHKQVHGFASGGFMLMNRRQDFVDAFGDAGEAVSCVGADDVAAKVDRFLSHPRHRREVGDAIRERIRTRFQLNDVLLRALHQGAKSIETMGVSTATTATPLSRDGATVQKNLLPKLRSHSETGATVEYRSEGAVVSTGRQQWSYAAHISIPAWVKDLSEPHVRLRLIVDAGRVGLAALHNDSGTLIGEQLVSPTTTPVTVIVDLPHEGGRTVILRNTLDTVSRARVLEASLCDRAAQ